jgi:hypothetical protein
MRTVTATRYVAPLHEGGSLPAIVEADDEGLYVLKFRGAGQGPRALGLPVPEIVFVELDAELARTEPDPEIQSLIRASGGLNIALDYLPGSVMFDPVAVKPDAALASSIVWFDAFVSNVDRTPNNTNLLVWHGGLQLIDHGAALYFHHAWDGNPARSRDPFPRIKDHVLLPFAASLKEADTALASRLSPDLIRDIVAAAPDSWLADRPVFKTPARTRQAYVDYLVQRLQSPRAFVEEAIRARSQLV